MGGLLPRVFRNNKVVISEDDITAIKGIINSRTSYMLIDSVKSVTVVVTPFGDRTGINFIILNAMGARLVLSFLTKTDCLKIAAHIDRKIKARR
ncbi:MAG: PH domain-containing protein [Ruminococcus sp.]|nr:PH domain-containing protein [Ruminococcus sp.]